MGFLKNGNIKIHGMIPREAAIKNAQKADVLLLVQHTDLRSSKTIPFKLYDYLNTENLIFGLTYKNDEIDDILIKHGHITSDASSVELIKKSLAQVFDKLPNKIKASKFDPKSAVDKMERIILN